MVLISIFRAQIYLQFLCLLIQFLRNGLSLSLFRSHIHCCTCAQSRARSLALSFFHIYTHSLYHSPILSHSVSCTHAHTHTRTVTYTTAAHTNTIQKGAFLTIATRHPQLRGPFLKNALFRRARLQTRHYLFGSLHNCCCGTTMPLLNRPLSKNKPFNLNLFSRKKNLLPPLTEELGNKIIVTIKISIWFSVTERGKSVRGTKPLWQSFARAGWCHSRISLVYWK